MMNILKKSKFDFEVKIKLSYNHFHSQNWIRHNIKKKFKKVLVKTNKIEVN